MTKTVFGSHSQTAHVWAQGRYEHGRASDGRIFFDGRILYSYGRHFALGLVILGPQGEPVTTLLNSDSYSVSTGKHKSHAWDAARGRRVYVPALTDIARRLELVTQEDSQVAKQNRTEWARKEVAAHIAKHWARYDDESAALVWGLMGGTEKQAIAMREKARKAQERAQAKRARDEAAALVEKGRELAAMTGAAFRSYALGQIGAYEYQAESNRARLGKELHQIHRALSKAGKAQAKRKLWAHIQTVRGMASTAVIAARLTAKRKDVRHALTILGQYRANEALPLGERRELHQAAWAAVAQAAYTVARHLDRQPSKNALALALVAFHEHARAQEKQAAEKAHAERLEKEKAAREAWQACEPGARYSGRTAMGGAFLRAVGVERDDAGAIIGGELQTSQGAAVPLAHALRAFRFIKLCRAQGQAWAANGRTVPVGHFRIDRIAANGDFHAGCHFIEWAQVEALALALGVADWAGDESAVVTREHA